MNIYPYFFKARQKADGTYPVYIFVSRPPKRFCVNSGLTTIAPFTGLSFPKKEPNSRIKTNALIKMINEIESLAIQHKGVSNATLKELIEEQVLSKTSKTKTLCACTRIYSDRCDNERTKDLYEQTARKIEVFDRTANFDIDKKWLDKFVDSMSELKPNSIAIHLRNIRTVFNWAIDEGITQNYPFRKFKIKYEETHKRNISAELIRSIRDMEVKDFQGKYRDLFILSFLLIGINPVDILNATPDQLSDGRLNYTRAKTHKIYTVKVEPEAMEIINRYRGKKHLLMFCDNAQYKGVASKTNAFLKTINENITIYSARHSWATIASDLDVPIDVISSALGHSHGSEVTQIYINYDRKKVDEANRKIIDYVFGESNKEGK